MVQVLFWLGDVPRHLHCEKLIYCLSSNFVKRLGEGRSRGPPDAMEEDKEGVIEFSTFSNEIKNETAPGDPDEGLSRSLFCSLFSFLITHHEK